MCLDRMKYLGMETDAQKRNYRSVWSMLGWEEVLGGVFIPDEACVKPGRWIVEHDWSCKANASEKIVYTYRRKKAEIPTLERSQRHHLTTSL